MKTITVSRVRGGQEATFRIRICECANPESVKSDIAELLVKADIVDDEDSIYIQSWNANGNVTLAGISVFSIRVHRFAEWLNELYEGPIDFNSLYSYLQNVEF